MISSPMMMPPKPIALPLRSCPRRDRAFVRDVFERREPCGRLAVTRRAPVASRRKRAARADLRGVRHGAALVLAVLEEALEEDAEPLLDGADVVFVAPG